MPLSPMPEPQRALAQLSLKGRALRYLATREHSRVELERRLASFEETPGQLALVLDELQAKDFISDARVIESVIHRRQAKLGNARIRQELQGKGLDREAVTEAVAGLQTSEFDRARNILRRKFASWSDPATPSAILPTERAKQMRFLATRGFSAEVARKAVFANADDECE